MVPNHLIEADAIISATEILIHAIAAKTTAAIREMRHGKTVKRRQKIIATTIVPAPMNATALTITDRHPQKNPATAIVIDDVADAIEIPRQKPMAIKSNRAHQTPKPIVIPSKTALENDLRISVTVRIVDREDVVGSAVKA